jgi:hypothetical protein
MGFAYFTGTCVGYPPLPLCNIFPDGAIQIHSGASGPGNWKGIFIERTLNMRQHYPCHNMSLPIAPFPKGQGGRSGGGGGLRRGIMEVNNINSIRGFAPQYQEYFFTQKSTKKPAPSKSPGVPLCRDSLRFSNSALMGQYKYTYSKAVSLIECMVDHITDETYTYACSITEPLAATANKSPCPLVRKGVKGDLGGAGDRIWFYRGLRDSGRSHL